MTQPSPPVPAKLREMLKDYPEHIDQLQRALETVTDRRMRSLPPFEDAVWKLEDCLSGFIGKASAELSAAEASGDSRAIELAKEKERLMMFARSSNIGLADLSELRIYIDANIG